MTCSTVEVVTVTAQMSLRALTSYTVGIAGRLVIVKEVSAIGASHCVI